MEAWNATSFFFYIFLVYFVSSFHEDSGCPELTVSQVRTKLGVNWKLNCSNRVTQTLKFMFASFVYIIAIKVNDKIIPEFK